MTFLQIVQRLRQECGVSGDGPSSVLNPSREIGRLVAWASQAYVEIQEDSTEWEWMRRNVSFTTSAGKNTYSPTADVLLVDFSHWRPESFRIYPTASGVGAQTFLYPMHYNAFRDYYLFGQRQTTQARPINIAIAPDKSLVLGLVPNDTYTVTGEYYTVPQVLADDSDVPEMPDRFHMAIVYRAMQKYGLFESAQEQITAGETQYTAMMNRLRRDQLPRIISAGGMI